MSAWPDIIVVLALLFGAVRGWFRGLVRELTGMLALGAAIFASFSYDGRWDVPLGLRTNLLPSSAHVIGMFASGFLAYASVTLAGMVIGRFARLPLIGTANAAAGAGIGAAKTAVFLWGLLYVALFFPLPHDVHDALQRSPTIALLTSPNERADTWLESSLPSFIRPYDQQLFTQHKL